MKIRVLGAALVVCGLLAGGSAQAAVIDVTTTADDFGGSPGSCSLREAMTASQTGAAFDGCPAGEGGDVIRLSPGLYQVTRAGINEGLNETGDFNVYEDNSLTIESTGPGVVIDGNSLDRVFYQWGSGSLTLRNLVVAGGQSPLAGDGGGILAGFSARLDGVTVTENFSAASGGGIATYGSINMINSTVSRNSANGFGGGIHAAIGSASTTVRSSTITGNVADVDLNGTGDGGGFSDGGADAVNFHNVINAGNTDSSPAAADKWPDCFSGPSFFPRHVLTTQALGAGSCLIGFDPGSNQVVTDPGLGPLTDNGGPTPTHALLEGSPAIGAGGSAVPDECPATDQRGVTRPAGHCDIGAFQLSTAPDPDPDPDPGPKPLPPIKNPTNTTAAFDGVNLHIRLKCPARFRPGCRSIAVPMTKRRGKAMAKPKRVSARSNRWRRVSFVIRPVYRAAVEKMTTVNRKRLVVRQTVRSKRVGQRKARRPSRVFHTYKVRARG